jgi:ferrous iron transport protein B
MKLSELKIGETAYIVEIRGEASFARRLSELGFVRGQKIHNNMKAPLMDPVEYEIMGTTITLRNSETKYITISMEPIPKTTVPSDLLPGLKDQSSINIQNIEDDESINNQNIEDDRSLNQSIHEYYENGKKMKDCFLKKGNRKISDDASITTVTMDNSSSDFNDESGIIKEATESTPLICKFCPERKNCEKRKYYVLSDINKRKWNGQVITVALVGNPNCGKTTLFNHISGGHEKEGNYCGVTVDSKEGTFIHNGVRVNLVDLPGTYSLASYSPEEKYVENYLSHNKIDVILNVLDSNNLERNLYLTLQCQKVGIPMVGALNMYDELEKRGDSINTEVLGERFGMKFYPTTSKYGKGLKEVFDEVLETKGIIPKFEKLSQTLDTGNTGECYAYITQMLEGIYTKSKNGKSKYTARIDALITNRWLGFIIFAIIIYIMFGLTFDWVGNQFMEYIESAFTWLNGILSTILPDGWFKDLICDGIIAGVGGVTVFLPNILILYLCVSILEDSGYMARAAFILDRIMRIFGLHGKSFIPMICGFGCNVPAVMSTRAIENRKSRLVTILVVSLFSCSARTPVYNVLANAFFPNHVTPVIFSLYAVGVVLALVLAKVFSLFLVKEKEMNYLMELPEYRLPSLLSVLKHTWERAKEYIKKMATVILGASIIIWFLSNFPRVTENDTITQSEKSYLGQVGKFMEPAFRPMGSTWKMDVGLLTGLGAKEVVVSTLSILYCGNDNGEENSTPERLSDKLANSELDAKSAYAYMLFVLLYFPCVATVTAIGNEAGWKWAGFVTFYTTALAWLVSTIFYQISSLF